MLKLSDGEFELIWQLCRYILGGLSSAAIIWGLIFFFVEIFSFHYLVASNLATACIYLYSFFVNKFFVFKSSSCEVIRQGAFFIWMRLFLLVIANIILFVGIDLLNIYYMHVVVFVSIFDAVLGFLIMRFKIFK